MTNKGSSGKDLKSWLKSIGGGIVGVIGFVTSLVAFFNLATGNKGIVTITMLVAGIGAIEVALLYVYLKEKKPEDRLIVSPQDFSDREEKWSYPRKKRRLALSVAIALPVLLVITGAWMYMRNRPAHKFVVLVTNFDGPKQYRTTDILVKRLREATQKYPEVEIQALSQSITEQQGPIEARKLGEDHNASVVLWGWYDATNSSAILTIHFEVLSRPKSLQLEKDQQTLNATLAEIERFEIQINLSDQMSYLTLLISGLARYEADDYTGAIERFTDALNLRTNPPEITNPAIIYVYRGDGYFEEHNLDKALADYSKAISLKPDYASAFCHRGIAYEHKGEHDLALADFSKVITINHDHIDGYRNRGITYERKGEYDLALADFNKAISLNPDDALAYTGRGVVYKYKREYDLAIADFSEAISLNPGDALAYCNRGIVYKHKGKDDLAIADYSKALNLKPDYALAFNNRGGVYVQMEKYNLAIADFNKAISLDPDYALAYCNRGIACKAYGEYDRAITDFNKAIDLEPDLAKAYYNRGTTYTQMGEYDLTFADFNRAISLKPDDALAYAGRGVAYEKKGEYNLAIADFSKAISLKPDLAFAYCNRACVYEKKGENDLAFTDNNKAKELNEAESQH
jgi:tetratricopeptide (TPR) repeat protein